MAVDGIGSGGAQGIPASMDDASMQNDNQTALSTQSQGIMGSALGGSSAVGGAGGAQGAQGMPDMNSMMKMMPGPEMLFQILGQLMTMITKLFDSFSQHAPPPTEGYCNTPPAGHGATGADGSSGSSSSSGSSGSSAAGDAQSADDADAVAAENASISEQNGAIDSQIGQVQERESNAEILLKYSGGGTGKLCDPFSDGDLNWVINNPGGFNKELVDACKFFKSHPDDFAKLKATFDGHENGLNIVTHADLTGYIAAQQDEIASLQAQKKTPRPQPNPPAANPPATNPPATNPPATNPPATNPPAANPPATNPPATNPPATNPPADNPADDDPSTVAPPKSKPPKTSGGDPLENACGSLHEASNKVEDKIESLSKKLADAYSNPDTPANKKIIATYPAEIEKLTRMETRLTQLETMLAQEIENISKAWHDVAMNAIHHIA